MNSRTFSRYLRLILFSWDIVVLNVSYVVSFILRYGNVDQIWTQERQTVWLFTNLLWITLSIAFKSLKIIRVERIEKLLSLLFKVVSVHLVCISLFIVALKYEEISRLRLLYFYSILTFSLIVFRVIFIKLIKWLRYKGYNASRVIIIGDNQNGRKIAEILSSDLTHGFKVLGFFDSTSKDRLGSFDDIESFIANNEVSEMYIALDFSEAKQIERLILISERYMVRVKFVPNFYSYTKARKVSIDFYGNIPILMLRKEPLQLPSNIIIKRLLDVFLSIFVIVFLFSWLFPVLMFLIYVSSKGPVFYKQVRSGEDNNPFICLKFRSMKLSSDDFVQATKNDPRVTVIGRILRKTNLDELPQVFNVLIGQMSMVGPRPHPLKLDEQYHQMVEKYLVRHFAKPGITGWAQVNGCRGETKELKDMQRRVDYDIWYIENWSFLLDLKIIWRTVVNMVRGDKNAY